MIAEAAKYQGCSDFFFPGRDTDRVCTPSVIVSHLRNADAILFYSHDVQFPF